MSLESHESFLGKRFSWVEKLKVWRRQPGPAGVADRDSSGLEGLRVPHPNSISFIDLEGQGFQSGLGDVLTTQMSLEGSLCEQICRISRGRSTDDAKGWEVSPQTGSRHPGPEEKVLLLWMQPKSSAPMTPSWLLFLASRPHLLVHV